MPVTDNVIELDCDTTLDIPPDRILSAALGKIDHSLIVIGAREDGSTYMAFSTADAAQVVFMLERAKMDVLRSFEDYP